MTSVLARLALCGGLLMGLASTTAAETANLAEIAKSGFLACVNAFPDPKKVHAAMLDDGWRYEQSTGQFRIYSKENRRLIAGTPTASYVRKGCMVAVSKLTGDQAVALAKPIVQTLPSAKVADLTDKESVAEWTATVNGISVRIGAMKPGDFFFMRGAGLIMSTE